MKKYEFEIIHGNTNMCDSQYLLLELNKLGKEGFCIKKVLTEDNDFVTIILQREYEE